MGEGEELLLLGDGIWGASSLASAQEQDIFAHHQVIVNRHDPVERFEVLAEPDFVSDGEVLSAAEICSFFDNKISALVSRILPEHVSAYSSANTPGQFSQKWSCRFWKETGETVI